MLLTLLLFLHAPGCDLDWSRRAEIEYLDGMTALEGRNHAAARDHFRAALEANPYHPRANFAYADCLDIRDQNTPLALAYFERHLELPAPPDAQEAERRIGRLRQLANGEMEEPVDVMADLLWAAQEGILPEFLRRLHPEALAFGAREGMTPERMLSLWKDWKGAEVLRREFETGQNGEEWALILIRVPDGVRQLVFRPAPEVEGSWLLQQAIRLDGTPDDS